MAGGVGRTQLELVAGDLTELAADAIVNAANRELVLGAGVAGAIKTKGGPTIQAECDRLAPIAAGDAVMTGAGRLRARHVIHAVGPRMGEGDEDATLARATRRSLELAEAKGLRWIAFPAISTGVFGFPMDRCAAVMLGAAIAFLAPGSHLERVTFCLFGAEAYGVFARELAALQGTPTRVQILLFAAAREAAACDRAELELPAPASAGDALAMLTRRFPALPGHAASLRLAVNRVYVGPEHPLASGDELALIPPTCGG
jgi:O-acetyl-ADP-ribose deacetylase (regulator of RNase III)/molybdopterin converting factor small subunit